MTAVATSYEDYLRAEWDLFAAQEDRQRDAVRALAGRNVRDVLDVGCGGGQDLIPFATAGAVCIGCDIAHESGRWAARQFQIHAPHLRVVFATCAAEHLPFPDASFDVVLCRVAIPYTNNRRALAEIGRVLRPGGVLLLKTHSARYYLHKLVDGMRRGDPLFSLHALRVLASGTIYHVTGWQPRGGMLLRETYQSEWLLRRELRRSGMSIDGHLTDSNPLTPSYRIVKER